jgi:hypothetical protein
MDHDGKPLPFLPPVWKMALINLGRRCKIHNLADR